MSKKRINGPGGQRDRPYNFMLVQQLAYLKPPYDTLDKLLERLKGIGVERCAGILHDKDSGEKAHIHISVSYTHLDVYKRQLLSYGCQSAGEKRL